MKLDWKFLQKEKCSLLSVIVLLFKFLVGESSMRGFFQTLFVFIQIRVFIQQTEAASCDI